MIIKAKREGECRSSNWGMLQQQLRGVAVVKEGVALDRPYIYTALEQLPQSILPHSIKLALLSHPRDERWKRTRRLSPKVINTTMITSHRFFHPTQ